MGSPARPKRSSERREHSHRGCTARGADRRRTSAPRQGPSGTAETRRCPATRGRSARPPRLQDRSRPSPRLCELPCNCRAAGRTQHPLLSLRLLCVTWRPACPGSVLHPAAAAVPACAPLFPLAGPCLRSCAPSGRAPCSLHPDPTGVQCEFRPAVLGHAPPARP